MNDCGLLVCEWIKWEDILGFARTTNWVERIPMAIDLVIHPTNSKKKEIQSKMGEKMPIYTAMVEARVKGHDPTTLDEVYKKTEDLINKRNPKRRIV
ncbi:hypothetical protein LINGRAHAP2_LOCUS2199 [Linum grandiflorum]